jgi:hypothetical protein
VSQSERDRYRTENDVHVIDVRVGSIEQLFDNRDPAPFRERDLDPDLVEYLLAASEDLAPLGRFRLVFWLEKPCQPGEIEEACRAHFEYEIDRLDRTRRRLRRSGQLALVIALLIITVLLSLSQLVARLMPGQLGAGLKEGLVISSWVVMWRPVEVLIYDGIPWRRERRVMRRVLEAPIEIRAGKGPEVQRVRHAVAKVPT